VSTRDQPAGRRPPPGAAYTLGNVLRSLTVSRGSATSTGITDVPLALDVVRILVLVVVLITVPLAQPHLGSGADGVAVAGTLGISAVCWVVWLLARRRARGAGAGRGRAAPSRGCPRGAPPSPSAAWSPPPWGPG
jgi:hypothetical protein